MCFTTHSLSYLRNPSNVFSPLRKTQIPGSPSISYPLLEEGRDRKPGLDGTNCKKLWQRFWLWMCKLTNSGTERSVEPWNVPFPLQTLSFRGQFPEVISEYCTFLVWGEYNNVEFLDAASESWFDILVPLKR